MSLTVWQSGMILHLGWIAGLAISALGISMSSWPFFVRISLGVVGFLLTALFAGLIWLSHALH